MLASDPAGDPSQDPLPLPDPEPDPYELDELKQLPLDPCMDAELSPEEDKLDHEWDGEGDLAHLCLVGEHTVEEEEVGGPSQGSASASLLNCVGAVEVEADGSVLPVMATLPPVLWKIASFKMYSAFLQLSGGGGCVKSKL